MKKNRRKSLVFQNVPIESFPSGKVKNIEMSAKRGLSLKSISAKPRVPKTTVCYHAREHCTKMTHMNIDALSEIEYGYLVVCLWGTAASLSNRGRKLTSQSLRLMQQEMRIFLAFCKICFGILGGRWDDV